jgi:hypothetical protein
MPIVPAFVGKTGKLGTIGQSYGLVHGQGVKIRPEGYAGPVFPGPVKGVKP